MTYPTTLYRAFDGDGRLLYVGCTINWTQRLAHHRTQKAWWTDVARVELQHFDSRTEAGAAEFRAIHDEGPLYNRKPQTALTDAGLTFQRRLRGNATEEAA